MHAVVLFDVSSVSGFSSVCSGTMSGDFFGRGGSGGGCCSSLWIDVGDVDDEG